MKIEAFKADDGLLFEDEKECRKHNIELQLNKWMNEDRIGIGYDMYAHFRTSAIRSIAEKIVNNKKSFNEIFSKLMGL